MKKSILIYIIIAVIFLLFAIWKINKEDKEVSELFLELNKEYPAIGAENRIHSVVQEIYLMPTRFRKVKNFIRVSMYDKKKYSIHCDYNLTDEKLFIQDVLDIGDSIKKLPASDTLIIINKKGKYYLTTFFFPLFTGTIKHLIHLKSVNSEVSQL